MSEHQHGTPINPLTLAINIARNGITKTLSKFVGKREAWKDKPYQAFQLESDGTDGKIQDDTAFVEGLNWIGKNNVKNSLNTILKRYGQDFVDDSYGAEGTADEGIFSLDKFTTFWTNLKSSAMKLSELNEAYQEEVAKYTELTDQMVALFGEGKTVGDPEVAAVLAKVNTSKSAIKTLKADFEERKAKRSKEAAAETVAAV